jgi:hypothetical protein
MESGVQPPSLAFKAWNEGLETALKARILTYKHTYILEKLRFLVKSGHPNPSDKALIEGENWCERTVFEARKRAKAHGLLTWRTNFHGKTEFFFLGDDIPDRGDAP